MQARGAKIMQQWRAQAMSMPAEERQAMLDMLLAGSTIGQVMEAFRVPLETVCGLINMNIIKTTHHSLRRESL
ncbi:MAG: hypothetical protein LBQ51_04760 [Desulfovibrio sp.]|jgi:hypothetical protein|nr:hypothetical protein [Desulfovibrio sp.]